MALRFRKTITLLPGVRLNLSKSGVSASVGGKGLSFNIGKDGRARGTIGLPGSGVSYSESVTPDSRKGRAFYLLVVVVGVVVAYAVFRWLH